MTLVAADWLVVALFFGATTLVGLRFARRGSQSLAAYFTAGRSLPWWLAGTSMVATTFAADTPLAVTALVALGALGFVAVAVLLRRVRDGETGER